LFLTVAVLLFHSTHAFGAGFSLYEGSARGNVLGAGLVASADDPSAVFYNPAGITQLKGTQVMVGITAITPSVTIQTQGVTGVSSNDMQTNWYFPPHAYLTYQINNNWWVGLGVFTRFGLGTEFQNGWPGRYNSYRAVIQEFEINPNVAYKVNDKFSVAAGLVGSYFNLTLQRALPTGALGVGDTDFKLAGDSWGWGWDIALQYKPFDWMQFGITYRSKIEQNIKGNVSVNPTTSIGGGAIANFANMSASGNLTLPDTIFTGVNFIPVKNLSIGGGVYWTGWQYYDKFQVNFGAPFGAPPVTQVTSPKNWANVARYLVGIEWKALEWLDVRLGYAYDQCPGPDNTMDYILIDNDRNMYSIGFGFHRDAWTADLSYTYIQMIDRSYIARPTDGIFPGKFTNGVAHLIGFSLGYKF
jgi:long-chain fatty acid transport protein